MNPAQTSAADISVQVPADLRVEIGSANFAGFRIKEVPDQIHRLRPRGPGSHGVAGMSRLLQIDAQTQCMAHS